MRMVQQQNTFTGLQIAKSDAAGKPRRFGNPHAHHPLSGEGGVAEGEQRFKPSARQAVNLEGHDEAPDWGSRTFAARRPQGLPKPCVKFLTAAPTACL